MSAIKFVYIGPWNNNTGLTHYATTWQVSDKEDFSNIILEEKESIEYLTTWEINLAIPSDEIYYVRALRHLKDSDGNIVEYDNWLGPKPLIELSSVTLEPLKPAMYIDEPYISSIDVDNVDGTTITLAEPKASVPVVATDWIIKHNGEIIFKSINDTTNITSLNIPVDVVNISDLDKIEITIVHRGDFGITSKTYRDVYNVTEKIFTFDKPLSSVNPMEDFVVKVLPTGDETFTVLTAYLLNLKGTVIKQLSVDNNTITIPKDALMANRSYKLSLTIQHVNSEGVLVSDVEEVYMKTLPITEQTLFDDKVFYKHELTELNPVSTTNFSPDFTKQPINTEQTILGGVGFPASDGSMGFVLVDQAADVINYIPLPSQSLPIDGKYFKLEMLPNYNFLVAYVNSDGLLAINIYKVDPYKNTYTLRKGVTLQYAGVENIRNNPFALINDDYYFILPNGNNTATIYKIDTVALTIESYKTLTFDNLNTIASITMDLVDYDTVILVPNTDNVINSYFYDFSRDALIEGPSIPSTLRGKELQSHGMLNGDVAYFKTNDIPDEYMYFLRKESTLNSKETGLEIDIPLNNTIKLRDGRLIKFIQKAETVIYNYIYE